MGGGEDRGSTLPSAKVKPHHREGINSWIHFHAAYSSEFATKALQEIGSPGSLVLDPYCGSGTTSRAAACMGCRSISVDLNPALVAISRAALVNRDGANSILRSLRRVQGPSTDFRRNLNGLTQDWLHPETASALAYYRDVVNDSRRSASGRHFGQGLLVSAAREIVRPQIGSNPTWPKPPRRPMRRDVGKILLRRARRLRSDIARFEGEVEEKQHGFLIGDAKNLPFKDATVDAVLTSPPYLSRLDYIRATLPELLALGIDSPNQIRALRESLMGGVLTTRAAEGSWPGWGPVVHETLNQIESHEAKASDTYYSSWARRYFADLDESVAEVVRVLKPKHTALFVVQTSYYKDVRIRLHDILVEIAEGYGATASVVGKEQVLQHLGRLSPHQRRYVPEKSLEEAVVRIRSPD